MNTPDTSRSYLVAGVVAAVLALSACSGVADVDEPDEVIDVVEEDVVVEAPKAFFLPTSCPDILSFEAYEQLTTEPVLLLRGPGSGSPDPVYPDGSPQEELGGISCYFGDIDETKTYTLSIAAVTTDNRAGVIDGLLEQKFNVDQTPTGALIYSIMGDEFSTPATYNTLHPEAWYEVLVSPGGRLSYEQAERLAKAMRDHTFR